MSSQPDATADANAPAESVAAALSSAAFVRIAARADGDALAGAGLLARGLRGVEVPFQVRVAPLGTDVSTASTDGLLVAVGSDFPEADVTIDAAGRPASLRAHDVATTLVGDSGRVPEPNGAVDPVLALAGTVASGEHPDSVAASLVEAATESGSIERRPGVAIPVDDVVDGLAHSTLVHAPFSGDEDAVRAELSSVIEGDRVARDEETRRSIASLVALAIAGDDESTPRGATAVERLLRPYETPDGPVATLGGFADVLNAVAVERPGVGVALALGHGGRSAALDAWRTHARAVHRAIGTAHTGRYDGVFVVRGDVGSGGGDVSGDGGDAEDDVDDEDATLGRLRTAAGLVRDFRSPEPLVAALGDGVAALAARESGAGEAAAALATEFATATAAWSGGPTRAVARFDPETPEADVIAAIREATR
ncbi:hypothetical protein [Halobellus limi]|uniref:Exonuclease RecJ n=1 Tax=Halobellus limi TaxID=699433 RepID=A0A1H5ZNU4_9EURY|nr:hypothetical protein [Halobellus limi]QCC48021.1 hypothetical protein DV707_10335 [Halobellus limi]SEG37684.1 hypothetical protein SAMN04488133_2085 [Halobellus limi]